MTILLVIIALSLLVLIHELGHFAAAKFFGIRVDEFGFGFPPRVFSFVKGETRYSLNLLPFGGFVRIFGEDAPPAADHPDAARAFASKTIAARALGIAGGVLMNVLAGWLLLSAVFMIGAPSHLGISEVVAGSPAEKAGLAAGDIIFEARTILGDGVAETPLLKEPISIEAFISLVEKAAVAETPVVLTILRDGETLVFEATGRAAPPDGEGALGIALFDSGTPRTAFLESFAKGAQATVVFLKMITIGLAEFFGALVLGKGALEAVTGPVGVVAVAAGSVAFGAAPFLNLMALISLQLAVLNILPIPALDGGRLFFLALEALKGSPVSPRAERATHAVGFALLLLLMVVVTVRDISRLIP
ncbi:MAG: site-2 protease family protein [Candidatus Brennerbacteria bacterium]|nr:site-2 protease family protein [Candidatus Brennerbacteria bacterium]